MPLTTAIAAERPRDDSSPPTVGQSGRDFWPNRRFPGAAETRFDGGVRRRLIARLEGIGSRR